jgi:hypothetical protein
MSINRQDLIDIGNIRVQSWERKNAELLSHYDTKKVRELIQTFSEVEDVNPVRDMLQQPWFTEQSESEQFRLVGVAMKHAFDVMFLTLYDRAVFDRHLVVTESTEEGEQQLQTMRADVAKYRDIQAQYNQQQAAIADEPVEVVEDPHDVCVREFHELGSAAFKAKYISNTANRPIYEEAINRGLL